MKPKRPRQIILPATIFVDDVLDSVPADCFPALRIATAEIEYVNDEPADETLVRVLLETELDGGPWHQMLEPFHDLGLDDLEMLVGVLRIGTDPAHSRVYELYGFPFSIWTWDAELCSYVPLDNYHPIPPLPVYTLPVAFVMPDRAPSTRRLHGRTADLAGSPEDAVQALAVHIARKMIDIPGAKGAIQREPIRAPLCALAGTLATVVADLDVRRRTCSAALFEACLRALDLAEHEETARRVLLADHPRAIAVDTSDLNERTSLPEWGGSLGIFQTFGNKVVLKSSLAVPKNVATNSMISSTDASLLDLEEELQRFFLGA